MRLLHSFARYQFPRRTELPPGESLFGQTVNRTKTFHVKQCCPIRGRNRSMTLGFGLGSGYAFEAGYSPKACPFSRSCPPFSRIAWCLGSALLHLLAAFKGEQRKGLPVRGSGGVTWDQRMAPEPAVSRFARLEQACSLTRMLLKPLAYAGATRRLPALRCPLMVSGGGRDKSTLMRPWISARIIAVS